MPGYPMSAWLNADVADLWERVDRITYGTADEDEDVLMHAHARVERIARWGTRPEPPPVVRRTDVIPFPDLARRKVG
jgi:hypothetical protein